MPDKVPIQSPLVSIITPSYNQGQFIEETILSVLKQDYPNVEHIVIDGSSTDNTLEILKKYDSQIKWLSEKDKGQADAVNKGIKLAKGDIIGWLNSDDTYEPGAIRSVMECFSRGPQTMVVYGSGFQINEDGSKKSPFLSGPVNFKALSKKNDLLQPSIFFRKKVIEEVGYLNPDLHYVMDFELWLRIFRKFERHAVYLPKFISNWRLYENTKTASRRSHIYKELFEVLLRYYGRVRASWMVGYIGEILLGYQSGKGILFFILHQKWPFKVAINQLVDEYGLAKAILYMLRFMVGAPLMIFQRVIRFKR